MFKKSRQILCTSPIDCLTIRHHANSARRRLRFSARAALSPGAEKAHRKCAFFPIRPIKKCSLRKERLHFWGVLLKYRWRVVGCGVPDAPCTARKFGAASDACTCHCRGGDSRARRGTDGQCRLPIRRRRPNICHCEAPKGPWRPERAARGSALGVQSRAGSYVFAEGSPVIQTGTARFPRRFAPRNDTSGSVEVHQRPCAVE